jgi:hypothetical protein
MATPQSGQGRTKRRRRDVIEKGSADSGAWRLIQINTGTASPRRNSAQAARLLLIYLNAGMAMRHRLTRHVGAHNERAIRPRS